MGETATGTGRVLQRVDIGFVRARELGQSTCQVFDVPGRRAQAQEFQLGVGQVPVPAQVEHDGQLDGAQVQGVLLFRGVGTRALQVKMVDAIVEVGHVRGGLWSDGVSRDVFGLLLVAGRRLDVGATW